MNANLFYLFVCLFVGDWGSRCTVLREEIVTGMQLMGVTSLDQLRPELVKYAGDSDRGDSAWARSRL